MTSDLLTGQQFGDKWTIDAVAAADEEAWDKDPLLPIYEAPLFKSYLTEARLLLENLESDALLNLPWKSRLSLAAASLLFWQQRIGLTQEDYHSDCLVADKISSYNEPAQTELLINDLKLAHKAQSALKRSTLYVEMIEKSADAVAENIARVLANGISNPQEYYTDLIEVQTGVWRNHYPEIIQNIPQFSVITEQQNLPQDHLLQQSESEWAFYMGPDKNGTPHWLENNYRHQGWLISHEYHHLIQWHLHDLSTQNKLSIPPLSQDTQAFSFIRDFNIPDFDEVFLFNDDLKEHNPCLRDAFHQALYLSRPLESAAFSLHDQIIAGLNERMGHKPTPSQPRLRTTAPNVPQL